jgi:hypothetical protein
MSNNCGCQGAGGASSIDGVPNQNPAAQSGGGSGGQDMSDSKPTVIPPAAGQTAGGSTGGSAGESAPTLTPSSAIGSGAGGGQTTWLGDKRVSALWGINQNRNSWVYITGVGWKKLANNSDSAVVALTALAAHAKLKQTNYTYREEADGMIHETYVW